MNTVLTHSLAKLLCLKFLEVAKLINMGIWGSLSEYQE